MRMECRRRGFEDARARGAPNRGGPHVTGLVWASFDLIVDLAARLTLRAQPGALDSPEASDEILRA